MEDSQPSSPVLFPPDVYRNNSLANSGCPTQRPFPTKTEKKATELSHAKNVFREQFATEVSYKEGELELIEERIQLAKLLLQRLRLGILAQHYGAAAFCPTTPDYREDTIGAQGSWEVFEEEFVNKNSEDEKQEQGNVKTESGVADSQSVDECKVEVTELVPAPLSQDEIKKENNDEEVDVHLNGSGAGSSDEQLDMEDEVPEEEDVPMETSATEPEAREHLPSLTSVDYGEGRGLGDGKLQEEEVSRFYSKKRVIVGNTSQYLDPIAHQHISSDGSTHKWMVYVRGPQADPDISHFVKAVRFFLHPSYHPNDIVRVKSPPFHLTRHGWGEFPVRVQLEFRDKVNKPVDILHNLVLDRTHTGQQTLGAETLVDLDIVVPAVEQSLRLNGFSSGTRRVAVVQEEKTGPAVIRPQQTLSSASSSSMSSSNTSRGLDLFPGASQEQHHEEADSKHGSGVEACRRTEGMWDGSTAAQAGEGVAMGMSSAVSNVITTNLDKCLHTAVRGIPICGKSVPPDDFYIPAPSLTQFRLWNIGRRRATEWMRAVAVKKSIQRKLHVPSLLSTRRVMVWCRQNGYTPLDPAPEGGRGFCKICGCQLGAEGEVEDTDDDDDDRDRGLDEEEISRRRKNLEVHEHCHSKLFGPGSYLREGFLDLYEDFQVSDYSTEEDKSRPKLSMLGQPHALVERVCSMEEQLRAKEKQKEDVLDTQGLPPSPSCARSRALVDIVPRYRVPQTPELKWIQQTASSTGIKIYPAVIDRMYAHVVEHMLYISCARFLRGILGQAIQGAWQGEEGGLSQDHILTPFHLQQAILRLEHCDFLTNRYLGVPTPSSGDGVGGGVGSRGSYQSSVSSSSCASSDEEEGL